MGYRAVGIYGWLLLSANSCLSINAHTSLAVLDIECLLWHHLSLMSVCYALHWIAFNSFVERWTILTLISNECGGVIDFNGLLPIGPSITLLPVWGVNHYSCHLWGTHLMYVVVVRHMTMLAWWMKLAWWKVGFLFFWTRVIFFLITKYDHYLE